MNIKEFLEGLESQDLKPLIKIEKGLSKNELVEQMARAFDEVCLTQELSARVKYDLLVDELEKLVGVKEAESIRTEIVKMAR